MQSAEIIIIGAGAAGLMAARQLARAGRSVLILEARNRPGGRIHTFKDKDFTTSTEGGAEFIHGKLKETRKLLKEYKIRIKSAKGHIWWRERRTHSDGAGKGKEGPEKDKDFVDDHHHLLKRELRALKRDMTVQRFLRSRFKAKKYDALRQSVTGFVEGYESAEVERFSVFAFREDWLKAEDWKQYRIEGGYGALIDALADDCRQHGCKIRYSSVVKRIDWKKNDVRVFCKNGKSYHASQVVITVPLGMLQQQKIVFRPALPSRMKALKALGYGSVIKVLLLFRTKFWQDKGLQKRLDANLNKLFFFFSQEKIPTWWTQYPDTSALLSGWLSGKKAKRMSTQSDRQILSTALQSLASIFETEQEILKEELSAWRVMNWSRDEFTEGSYSYATVSAEKNQSIAGKPVKSTLFFAGEHFGEPAGTVEAALKSGIEVARMVIGKAKAKS